MSFLQMFTAKPAGGRIVSFNPDLQWCLNLPALNWNWVFKCLCASGVLPRGILAKEGWDMWGRGKRDGQGWGVLVVMQRSCKPFPGLVWAQRQSMQGWRYLWLRTLCRNSCRGDRGRGLTLVLQRCGIITSPHWDASATLSPSALDLCKP